MGGGGFAVAFNETFPKCDNFSYLGLTGMKNIDAKGPAASPTLLDWIFNMVSRFFGMVFLEFFVGGFRSVSLGLEVYSGLSLNLGSGTST